MDTIKKTGAELKTLKEAYNNLLGKHEELLNEIGEKEKKIVCLLKKIQDITPYRDSKGRYAKRPN